MQHKLDIVETDYYLGLIDRYDTFVECLIRNPEIKEYFPELMSNIAKCMRLYEDLSLLYKGHISEIKVSKNNPYVIYCLETFENIMECNSYTSKILTYVRTEENNYYRISGNFVDNTPQNHKFPIYEYISNFLIKIVCKINKIKEFTNDNFENFKELCESGKCTISVSYL
ncbi:hypothetical protein [Methanococcus voltae]|uniref:Uncharacterized protein n=1 Tax=Methanococcus voltae (strain ATCC BAA-1334 / A3) TaxID=456320 RepID=D7DS93_METV3|nr:hypothetical protein [Methanococcus voltae]MCS3901529.1 hypothetical protein [Methanococcus voltae]